MQISIPNNLPPIKQQVKIQYPVPVSGGSGIPSPSEPGFNLVQAAEQFPRGERCLQLAGCIDKPVVTDHIHRLGPIRVRQPPGMDTRHAAESGPGSLNNQQ